MAPNGPYGTGQPCALTQSVPPTLKSWFDCVTIGEKPSGSSAAITSRQRVPARTRMIFRALSGSITGVASEAAKPSRARLCPPME